MTRKRTWPAYVVLALCGAPIFIIAAWKFVTDTPVESLVIDLDGDGNATLTANRRWTSEVRTGFRLPRDGDPPCETVKAFVKETERGANGLPVCSVRVVVPGEARAGIVHEAIIALMRCYLWDVVLESDGLVAPFALPMNEGRAHIRAVPSPRDVRLVGLHPPAISGKWTLEAASISQAVPACSDTMSILWYEEDFPAAPKSGIAEKIGGRTVVRDLDDPGVGILDAPEWRALVEAADERKTVTLAAPEDADLSGVDGAYVLTDADARAGDLVRALEFLTSREGLKVYIVWPEREGDEDWWGAP
ncbi:MAG: hypothetical protein ACYS9X_25745 [Planctomycetota bacterium]